MLYLLGQHQANIGQVSRAFSDMAVGVPVSPKRFVAPASLIIYTADNSLWDEVTAATLMYGTFWAKLAVTVHFRGSFGGYITNNAECWASVSGIHSRY